MRTTPGQLALDGEELVVNGRATAYVAKARTEADRAAAFLRPALADAGQPALAARLVVRAADRGRRRAAA